MNPTDIEQLRFPIGKYVKPEVISSEQIQNYISIIEDFPAKLKKETENLSDKQLDTQYRPEGWTIRQVVHHCADSHMNSIIRFKLALTEDKPTIEPYWEDRWAQLPDSQISIEPSLKLLEGLHQRWTVLLKSLTANELEKRFIHPGHGKEFILSENIGVYSWHCNHHLAHVTELKKRLNWK